MWRIVLLCLCLIVSGCRFVPMREIAISPCFTDEQTEEILLVIDEWFDADPSARMPVVIAEPKGHAGSIAPASGKGRRDPCVRKIPGTTLLGFRRAPRVLVCLPLIERESDSLRFVVLHELGHALGRNDEHLPAGNVMAEKPSRREKLTAADIEFIRRKR